MHKFEACVIIIEALPVKFNVDSYDFLCYNYSDFWIKCLVVTIVHIIAYSFLALVKDLQPRCSMSLCDEREFHEIGLLSTATKGNLRSDTLYVSLQPNTPLYTVPSDIVVACAGSDRFFSNCQTSQKAAIVFPEGTDMANVFNRLLGYWGKVADWIHALDCAVAAGNDLQVLMDLSEPLFRDPIIVMSKTLQVLACTRHIHVAHPDVEKTLQDGFFPRNMVQGLIENHYLQAAEEFHEIGYHYPPNYVNCTKIIKVFDENVLQVHTVCLYGFSQEPTPEAMYLMKVLCAYIQKLITLQKSKPLVCTDSLRSCVLTDIIDKEPSEEAITCMALQSKWPQNRESVLACIKFSHYLYPYTQFMINCLQAEGFGPVILHDHSIIALEQFKPGSASRWEREETQTHLIQLLKENGAYCGLSTHYEGLGGTKHAYAQAVAAVHLGQRLAPEKRLYPYTEYYAYHVLELSGTSSIPDVVRNRKLEELQQYDIAHDSNQIQFLRTLLWNERNITAVAQIMHMHRNSVLYRVAKLQERLGVSFADPNVRLMLQLSLLALDMEQEHHAAPMAPRKDTLA